MRLLVTGTQGQVVTALRQRAGADVEVIALGRPELDLAQDTDLTPLFARFNPDVIVNAAAYTAVDKAESEPDLAFAINARGAGAVAQAAKALHVPVVQISTDYVFDGTAIQPLREDDVTHPLGTYGASKLAGEAAVVAATENHVILRTAWVYAPFGANFVRSMLRLATTRDELRVVADQFGTPTSAIDIAACIEAVAKNLLERPADAALRGVFHMTAQGGPISWADFAREIFKLSAAQGGPSAKVVSISTAEYPTPARRPAYSCLDGQKLTAVHNITLAHWQDSLRETIDLICKGNVL